MLFSDEPEPPYDDGMWDNIRQSLTRMKPRLLVASLLDPDEAAHIGDWEGYLQAIRHDDKIIWDVWQQLQADPFYAGQTVLIVTNDHGRGCGDGWRDHGGVDDCNRHVMFLAVGPGIRAGHVTSQQRTLLDIAPTIGHLLGFETPYAGGQIMTEILNP
jgi:phosphopentomutase